LDKRAYLYDNLAGWEKNKGLYPIHKRLLPFEYKGHTCRDVNDVIHQQSIASNDKVLDAGCGVGNTIIGLVADKNVTGFGISISAAEIVAANKNALSLGVEKNCHFFNQGFDEPFSFHFNKAIAIESFKHSFDINKTAINLFNHCNTGGQLYIIDDFYTGTGGDNGFEKQLIQDWELQYLYSRKDFILAFTNAGFVHQSSFDFSTFIIPKSTGILQLKVSLFAFLEKASRNLVRKNLLAVFKSGFILEYLFQKKKFTYELLVFRKPSEP
jgi:SAM-dependent methyltransferase